MSYELTRIRDFPSSGCPEFGFIYGSSRNFLLLHSSRFDAQNPDPIIAHWSFRLECLSVSSPPFALRLNGLVNVEFLILSFELLNGINAFIQN
jgi:hypothetical protein